MDNFLTTLIDIAHTVSLTVTVCTLLGSLIQLIECTAFTKRGTSWVSFTVRSEEIAASLFCTRPTSSVIVAVPYQFLLLSLGGTSIITLVGIEEGRGGKNKNLSLQSQCSCLGPATCIVVSIGVGGVTVPCPTKVWSSSVQQSNHEVNGFFKSATFQVGVVSFCSGICLIDDRKASINTEEVEITGSNQTLSLGNHALLLCLCQSWNAVNIL